MKWKPAVIATAFCVGGGRSYWLLGTRTYLATNRRLAEYIIELRGRTYVRTMEIIVLDMYGKY